MDRTCQKCNKVFTKPCFLAAHMARKTSCELIVNTPPMEGRHICKYCGRNFSSQQSMNRHIRTSCKVTNREEAEYTLRDQINDQQAMIANQTAHIKNLTTLMEKMVATRPAVTEVIAADSSAPNETEQAQKDSAVCQDSSKISPMEVLRGLNDRLMGVVQEIEKTPEEIKKLTTDVQNIIGLMGIIYGCDPIEYQHK
jgi:hypothetical protein